jgi:N-carbamoylputrescine amidase
MPGADGFTLGLVQMRCTVESKMNLATAETRIRDAARAGAQIVCLPELFQTPYFCQRTDPALFDLAEPIPGPSTERLARVARECGVVLVASLFEKRAPGLFHNTAVVFDADGTICGIYRKMHIPDDPLYYEKYYFTPGDIGFRCFNTRFAKIGTLVCWDQWYPEAARLTALRGAEILIYPTAIGWHPREKKDFGIQQHDAWELAQRAHALANGVYVAAINRVGHEGDAAAGLEFWGASFVSDPFGVVMKRASHEREELVLATCHRSRIEDVRRNWPFLRDRRIDAFGDITKRMIDG